MGGFWQSGIACNRPIGICDMKFSVGKELRPFKSDPVIRELRIEN
jgi:hypothetical protein